MTKVPTYIIKKPGIRAKTTFFLQDFLPEDIPISTPLTFPVHDDHLYLLTLDKNKWWNPVCGHIDNDEGWQTTLKRESREEVGADISDICVKGYIKVEKILSDKRNPYPPITIIPVTTSKIISIDQNWSPRETKDRSIVNYDQAVALLKCRNDNHQMLGIFTNLFYRSK